VVPPCAFTSWPLTAVIEPGNLTFRLKYWVNGALYEDIEIPAGSTGSPWLFERKLNRYDPHEAVATVQILYPAGQSSALSVHVGCLPA